MLGATLYLPKEWTRDRVRGERVGVPPTIRFQEKWRLAVTLVRRARAAGLTFTAVLADAAYGDVTVLREALHRLNSPYALGISSHLTVFVGVPRTAPPEPTRRRGRPPTCVRLIDAAHPMAVSKVATILPRARLAAHQLAQRAATDNKTQAEICEAPVDLNRTQELTNGGWRVGESATGKVLHEHLHSLTLVA
jgi:SRSO17 transposase